MEGDMAFKNNLIGLLLLPFCIGFLSAFSQALLSIRTVGYGEVIFFSGFVLYPFFHYLLFKPKFISTFSHELTHALWGIAFRARIRDMRVKRESGFVNLSKTNFMIRLAPYIFPFFSVVIALSAFFVRPGLMPLVFFLLGFTLSFHLLSTIETLKVRQPDVYKTGTLFSLPIIFISNLIIIVLTIEFVSPENILLTSFLKTGFAETLAIFKSRY